eukprot:COSAG01_NODE_6727_length_3526_cov_10.683980_1_plen_79_part_00
MRGCAARTRTQPGTVSVQYSWLCVPTSRYSTRAAGLCTRGARRTGPCLPASRSDGRRPANAVALLLVRPTAQPLAKSA